MQFTEKQIEEFKEIYYKQILIKKVIENWTKLVNTMKYF